MKLDGETEKDLHDGDKQKGERKEGRRVERRRRIKGRRAKGQTRIKTSLGDREKATRDYDRREERLWKKRKED